MQTTETLQKLKSPHDLKGKILETYLEWEGEYLTNLHKDAKEQFEDNPTDFNNIMRIVQVDGIMGYSLDDHNALLAENFPEKELLDLPEIIPNNEMADSLLNMYKAKRLKDLPEEPPKINSPTDAKEFLEQSDKAGAIKVDLDEGTIKVGGIPMTEVFAQAVKPTETPEDNMAPTKGQEYAFNNSAQSLSL